MRDLFFCIAVLATSATAFAEPAEIPADSIRKAVEAAFRDAAPPEASLEILSIPTLRHEGPEPLIVVAMPEAVGEPGARELAVSCRVNDREVAHGVAAVVVRVKRFVWVAGRDLDGDGPLDLSELRRETRVFDHVTPRLFRPEPGARFRLARDVPEGAVLEVSDVLRIPDQEPGEDPGRASVDGPTTWRTG